jgi:hypothetical protein
MFSLYTFHSKDEVGIVPSFKHTYTPIFQPDYKLFTVGVVRAVAQGIARTNYSD